MEVSVASGASHATSAPSARPHTSSLPRGAVACGAEVCSDKQICCELDSRSDSGATLPKRRTCAPSPLSLGGDPGDTVAICTNVLEYQGGNVTTLSCDDSQDCKDALCTTTSQVDVETVQCGPGALELCNEGTCKTRGTHCRRGVPCPFFGHLCEEHAVCVTDTPPRCGAEQCTDEKPLCCASAGKERCAAACESNPSDIPVSHECTRADGCGPDMDCCVSTGSGDTNCALSCDIGVQAVACESDEECARYRPMLKRCSQRPSRYGGLRVCE
ncbi:MAG: hypothetical protein U0271_38670 [Polyangiaceae bacterium]